MHLKELIKGKTILLVTHKSAVLGLVDKLILMDRGRIIAAGPRDDVIAKLQSGAYKAQGTQGRRMTENKNAKPAKKTNENRAAEYDEFDLRKFDLTRKYDDDFSPADGIAWRDHILLYFIAGLLGLFILWANLATLEEASRGEGKVIPSSEIQVIQSLEGGIIELFPLKTGDRVEKGQVILHLRNEQFKSDLRPASRNTTAFWRR